jgi:hypothetical protein
MGIPFMADGTTWDKFMKLVETCVDVFCFGQYGDKGSNNLPAMSHFAAKALMCPRAIADIDSCELHALQSIKSTSPSIKDHVGRMYALSNASKVASFFDGQQAVFEHLCDTTVHRIVAPPPHDDFRKLADALFDLNGEHHNRRGGQKSLLWQDLQQLIRLASFKGGPGMPGARIHYCWNPATSQPCCGSEEETRESTTVAHVNFHLSRSFP